MCNAVPATGKGLPGFFNDDSLFRRSAGRILSGEEWHENCDIGNPMNFGLRLQEAKVPYRLRLAGVLMVLTGGIGAAFQRHLGRILGFAVILETGFTLLAAGIQGGAWLTFVLLFPRALAFGVWSLAMAYLWNQGQKMDYQNLQGIGRRMPVVAAAMVLAQFSLAGFPLLAGFPIKLVLWDQVAAQSGWQALFSLFGCIGLFASGLRSLAVFVTGPDDHPWKITESWQFLLLLGVGLAALLLVGLFPQLFLPSLINGLNAFSHLRP